MSGADNPRGQNFDVNRNLLSLRSFATSFKKISLKSDFIQFFLWFYTCLLPWGRGWQPLGNKIFMSIGTSCHFGHLLQVSKKPLWSLILYKFCFMILYMYIAPGQGQTAPRGQSFDVNRNVLSLHSFVASFKKIFLKSDFIQFFHDLIHVYIPWAGADSPQGTKFWCQHRHGVLALVLVLVLTRVLFFQYSVALSTLRKLWVKVLVLTRVLKQKA